MPRIAQHVLESTSRISRAIQVGSMRPANHAATEFVDDGLIFEALFQGIEVTRNRVWYNKHDKKTKIHRVEFEVDKDLYRDALNFAWDREKDTYHFPQLITFLPILRATVGKLIPDKDHAWVCSEFCETINRIANINFVHKITKPSDISPGNLLDSVMFERGTYCYLTGDAISAFCLNLP